MHQTPAIDPVTRRRFLHALTALAAAPSLAQNTPPKPLDPGDLMRAGTEKVFILLYPGFTALDAIGPEYMLSCMVGATVRFIAKTTKPVRAESGFEVTPHLSFADLPEKPTLFLVPGGTRGTLEAIGDAETRNFVRKAGTTAELCASVCTGSLLLGAAGLLNGYEATSHWQMVELLPIFGARPSTKRYVFDRNRATAAGVTAGLDFSLELVRRYRGDLYAQGVQLLGEYDPQPSFPKAGNPATADDRLVLLLNEMHKPFVDQMGDAIRTARR